MMSRDATTITPAHETTCARITLDPGMIGRLVHHGGVEIIATTCVSHEGRLQYHVNKEAAIVTTMTDRAISTTIARIEDRKSGSNEHHVKATVVTGAKPHSISRSRGASKSLDMA